MGKIKLKEGFLEGNVVVVEEDGEVIGSVINQDRNKWVAITIPVKTRKAAIEILQDLAMAKK
uniref:Uncharacterized protein n=1 Tax=viral metagenome TaxID=1070528 RepID=A0A6M3KYL9_9ZZZZ